MKKLLLILLFIISITINAQERMSFLDISFSNSNKEFQEKLIENNFYYTGDYYYYGEFMGYIRILDFVPSCIKDEIYKLTLICTHQNLIMAIKDYELLRKELIYDNEFWDVSCCDCIIYPNGGEIILERLDKKVIITFIDKISEERTLIQK